MATRRRKLTRGRQGLTMLYLEQSPERPVEEAQAHAEVVHRAMDGMRRQWSRSQRQWYSRVDLVEFEMPSDLADD